MMGYEYTDAGTGTRYWQEGKRVYRIVSRHSMVYDHDVTPPAPLSWWRRLWAWVQSWL